MSAHQCHRYSYVLALVDVAGRWTVEWLEAVSEKCPRGIKFIKYIRYATILHHLFFRRGSMMLLAARLAKQWTVDVHTSAMGLYRSQCSASIA